MNRGKAPDEYGLSVEHLKTAIQQVAPVITNIFKSDTEEKGSSN